MLRQLSQSQNNCVQKLLYSKTRDPLSDLLYLQKPLPVLGWVVWSGVHPDKMYNNQKINYMTKSLSKILLERMSLEKMLNYKFEGFDKIPEAFDVMDKKTRDLIKPVVKITW